MLIFYSLEVGILGSTCVVVTPWAVISANVGLCPNEA
jgi:hypothetical protein